MKQIGKREKGTCPVCGKLVTITNSGRLWVHGWRPDMFVCPGEWPKKDT